MMKAAFFCKRGVENHKDLAHSGNMANLVGTSGFCEALVVLSEGVVMLSVRYSDTQNRTYLTHPAALTA